MPRDLPDSQRLLEALEDELAAEALPSAAPVLPPPPKGRAARVRRALALLGGVGSARAIARALVEDGGPDLSPRQVREALRGGATPLGAGYLALPDAVEGPVRPWLLGRLRRVGPQAIEVVIEDIMARWPHGDPAAIRAWLHQDPQGVVVVDGVVRLPGQR